MKKIFTALRSLTLLLILISLPITGFNFKTASADVTVQKKEIVKPVLVKKEIEKKKFDEFLTVKATYYNATFGQCDSTPTITASGDIIDTARATELHWCAISWDLHQRYGGPLKFGDVIEITGTYGKYKINGKYIVKDLMADTTVWTMKIDILRHPKDKGRTFDSIKIKNKKFKEFKRQKAKEAKNKAIQVKKSMLRDKLFKLSSKIPFIGSDILIHEHFANKTPIELKKVSPEALNKQILI